MTVEPLAHARAVRQLADFCGTQIPERARSHVRLETTWRGNTATLLERRVPWDGRADWASRPIARFRYEPDDGRWRVYWQRANGRWLEVEELRSADFAAVLRNVGRDRSGVFWG